MWNSIQEIVIAGVIACFSWLDMLFSSIPGSWSTIFTLITICVISRFLLTPLLGFKFNSGSDKASKNYSGKSSNKEE